jgi:ABC-type sugar transport system permease subunit
LWDQGGASTLVVIMFLIALCVTFAQLRIYLRGNRKKGMD